MSAFVADLKAQIDTTEAKILHLTSQIDELDRVRQYERRTLGRLWMMILPVGRLPNELLVEIFDLVVQADAAPRSGIRAAGLPILPLAQICTRWREIVISAPKLWAACRLDVHLNRDRGWSATCLDGLKTQLDRSAPLPISVSLAFDLRMRDPQVAHAARARAADIIQAMVVSASRWKELKLDSQSFLHLAASVTPGIFASLECLNLRYFPQSEEPSVLRVFLPCPNLRRVSVRPFVGQLQMPWAQLTNLELYERSATTCRAILLQCTSLVSAKVITAEWVTAQWGTAPIDAPHTVLPCLTSLALTFIVLDMAAWRLDPFLIPFTLPALQTLTLGFEPDSAGQGGVWPEQELSAFQDRAPNLAQMSLLFCALESDDLIALLSHAPALTELKLVECENCIDDAFLQRFRYDPAQMQPPPLAPRLRELDWRGIGDHFTADLMEDAIRSRCWTDETERQRLAGANPNPPGVVRLEKVVIAALTDVLLEALVDRMWDLKDEGLDLILVGNIGAM
ncbi:hypothetical protein B0H19DRAFT_1225507 [Mycena capillaripes]|nr:hypothetical protein B0H19DRAFT_1225507 [Mycena capillaripes]